MIYLHTKYQIQALTMATVVEKCNRGTVAPAVASGGTCVVAGVRSPCRLCWSVRQESSVTVRVFSHIIQTF
jgi:hypothetical protein